TSRSTSSVTSARRRAAIEPPERHPTGPPCGGHVAKPRRFDLRSCERGPGGRRSRNTPTEGRSPVESRKDGRIAWVGLALIVVGTVAALWAVGQLADGVAELPRHWWSTLAALPMALGIVITAAGLAKLSRSPSRG